jgi:formylglycine-generating enzyme required for sulfatase activity
MPLHLEAGRTPLTGYTLVRLLGRGGFGEVWEASAPGGFHVALKFLRLETREAGVEERSLEVIRNIRHPHLLDVQFATRVDDCLVIAMPLCGHSLMHRLRDSPQGLPRGELLGYMAELARAVDYLNEPQHPGADGALVGVQHRDIKPHNVFVVGNSVRLADFGLAKIVAGTSGSHTGSMSVHYVAPEVIEGRVSRNSDQYSLAVTYCELRTGRLPFEGETAAQLIYAHMQKEPDLSRLPEAERPVVARALAKRPEERWPSCREFVRALAGAARGTQASALAKETPAGKPAALNMTLPETMIPPPLRPTVVEEKAEVGSSSPSGDAGRGHVQAVLAGVALSCVLLVAVFVAYRLGMRSSADTAAGSAPPAVAATPAPRLSEPVPTPARTADLPKLQPPSPPQEITSTIGMRLVRIPAGEFLMGSPDSDRDTFSDEKPQHRVRITRPFYLGMYEVTQGQYRAVTGANPSHFRESDDLPVEQVSWEDGVAFCTALTDRERSLLDGAIYRLPTEAEWEYTCRAGSTTRYSFGDNVGRLGEFAWYGSNSGKRTHAVGQKRANAWGLFDMHGNVSEWCQDGYAAGYYKELPGADPAGPSLGVGRVYRSGSWDGNPQGCRSAYRNRGAPGDRDRHLGFRVARVPPAP